MILRPPFLGFMAGIVAVFLGWTVGCRCDSGAQAELPESGSDDTTGSGTGLGARTYEGPIIDPLGELHLRPEDERFTPLVEPGQSGEGQITLGRPTVVGPLPRAEIEGVFSRFEAQLMFCYQSVLQADPHVSGAVTVVFFVQADGTVYSQSIEETQIESNDLDLCLLSEVATMQFPPPLADVRVRFPLLFEP